MALQYKFVELSRVTDDCIEECVNQWVGRGWSFEGIRFVCNDSSRRPVMAFVSFTRDGAGGLEANDADNTSPMERSGNPLAAIVASGDVEDVASNDAED